MSGMAEKNGDKGKRKSGHPSRMRLENLPCSDASGKRPTIFVAILVILLILIIVARRVLS